MMRAVLLAGVIALVALAVLGSPWPGEQPERARYYDSPEPILPMRFDHPSHATVNCLTCHHEFVDDSGNDTCMSCHVRRPELAAQLEAQFHGLCRDCHVDRDASGEAGGPPRACVACHVIDGKI
ncbi:MAG: cytochrome c3 family protein [Pseudomonadales bacterium]